MLTSSASPRLPPFSEHPGHSKRIGLASIANYHVESGLWGFLREVADNRATRQTPLRILDIGCGRGELTAWLLTKGWDAWGVDVEAQYIANGLPYFDRTGLPADRLRIIEDNSLPFDTAFFDVVVSNQVLEHVADLSTFTAGIGRVSKHGAAGYHIYPGRRILIEPHLRAPLVHWIPKGRARRLAIMATIATGASVDYFPGYSLRERTQIHAAYSEQNTFYRSRREIATTFAKAGMICEFRVRAPDELRGQVRRFAAERSGLFGMTHLRTVVDS
jgi:SAM-dependent methyltransferase